MKMSVDVDGLDEFASQIDSEYNSAVIASTHKSIDDQKERNLSEKKPYKNHTWNLRNAPGAIVIRDNEIIDMYVPADSGHNEAKMKTENYMIYGKKPKNGIVIADGMEYASFVSSKGFDVIDTGAISLKNELEKI